MLCNLENFGGIFRLSQLKHVKILSFPVSLIILLDDHWISIYLSNKSIEIMDSAGILNDKYMPKSLRRFLRVHIYSKRFSITPQLQKYGSSVCGKFASVFIYYKTITGRSLCEFSKIFTSDFDINCLIINNIFDHIKLLIG